MGAHVSIAGGVGEALIRGKALGCECIQIFTKSSRQWKSRPYTGDEIAAFKRNRKETGIDSIIAHNSYLLNLGSPDEPLRKSQSRPSSTSSNDASSWEYRIWSLILAPTSAPVRPPASGP